MSVGDIKGARRRIVQRINKGEYPRPKMVSVHASIEREKKKALRMAAASGKK